MTAQTINTVSDRDKALRLAILESVVFGKLSRNRSRIIESLKLKPAEFDRAAARAKELGIVNIREDDVLSMDAAAWVAGLCERRMYDYFRGGRLGKRLTEKRIFIVRVDELIRFARTPRKAGNPHKGKVTA